MKVVLNTMHLGNIGGGENYMMRFAMALNKLTDFYVCHNWSDKFKEYNGFGDRFKPYDGLFTPDLYIFNSHFVNGFPIGRKNYLVTFFPKPTLNARGFDGVVAICGYSAKWVKEYWGCDAYIIEPCVDPALYVVGPKERKIISIGHFFEEPDGHSKNQHILAEAFTLSGEGFELVLAGNANTGDGEYVSKVRKSSSGKRIRIETNKDNGFLKAELATASHLWHANGYGRSDPAQAEHFGIIALEAIASGVIPIVHASGGCRDIVGVFTWDRPDDLVRLTRDVSDVPRLDPRYTVAHFEEEVEKWLKGIST